MGWACSTNKAEDILAEVWRGNLKGRYYFEDLAIDGG